MSEIGECDTCKRRRELAEGKIVCVECDTFDRSCPSCGQKYLNLVLTKCVVCGKVVCDFCRTITVNGLSACSDGCHSAYCRKKNEDFRITGVW